MLQGRRRSTSPTQTGPELPGGGEGYECRGERDEPVSWRPPSLLPADRLLLVVVPCLLFAVSRLCGVPPPLWFGFLVALLSSWTWRCFVEIV